MSVFRRFTSARGFLLLTTVLIVILQTYWSVQSARTRGFATGDGGVKLWQVQGILQQRNLNAPLQYPGAVYDPQHDYAPFVQPWGMWYQGQPYTEYTSPFIWASVPLYAAFDHAGLLALPWLSGVALILMTAWLAWRARPDRWACLAPLLIGLSSPLLIYSLEFWEHTPGTALAVFALLGVIKAMDSRRRTLWLILSGAAIGLGLTMRAELYVYPIAIVLGLMFIRPVSSVSSIRSIVWLAVGGLIVAGPWWVYQFVIWGSPFGPRLQQNVPVLGGTEMLTRLGDTTGRNYAMLWPTQTNGSTVILGLLIALVLVVLVTRALRRKRPWLGTVGFWSGVAISLALAGLLAWQLVQGQRPDDLLTTFPIILLLILPAPWGTQHSALSTQHPAIIRLLLIVPLAFVVLVMLVSPFHGGIQWGPRFLLPIIPPLSVLVLDRVAQLWGTINRSARAGLAIAFLALFMTGSIAVWQGVQFMRQGQIASEFMGEMIRNMPEHVVVADAWFLPQMAPYTFGDKIWLLAEDEKKMFQLLQHLRKETDEPGMIYVSALTWAHIDPQTLMGPRLAPAEGSEKVYVNAPTQYVEVSRYQLLK